VTSSNPVNYGTKKGWYLDLKPSSGAPKGERVLSAPMLFDGRILFGSFEPQLGACETGGSTWLILLDPLSGGRITDSGGTWDIAGSGSGPDGTVDSADLVTVGGGSYSPSGLKVNDSINRNLAVIVSGGNADAFTNRGSARFNLGLNRGRQSWRQLQ
jgi:type IV pilus assembly protein PilY1